MPRRKSIGQAELEVLKHIAEHPGSTVRQAADHFAVSKGYVRPTVLKMMERLREKGYLERESVDGVFVYKSTASTEELSQVLVEDFVKGSLDGSVTPMVAYLFRKGSMSASDVAQLKQLIEQLDRGEKGSE